jgi:hypothetical protein
LALITPNSTIKILRGAKVFIGATDVLYFSSRSEQTSYFDSCTKYTFPNCTYVREQNKLRVEMKADNLFDCNYIMYQNTAYGTKWFYAFITNVEYVNDTTSYISFVIDDFQTWKYNDDYTLMPSFVEREHVMDDTIGAHIMDESFALNDYVTNAITSKFFTEWYICIGSTVPLDPLELEGHNGGQLYGKIYSGINWYIYDNPIEVNALLHMIDGAGRGDGIISMFMIPKDIVGYINFDVEGHALNTNLLPSQEIPVFNLQTVDGYTPRNNKLLTYPYRGIMLTNNEGRAITLRYEFFDENPVIEYVGGIQPSSTVIAYPKNYKGVTMNLNESVSVGNFPQCCWQKGVYDNWFAQQSVRWNWQTPQAILGTAGKLGSSALTGVLAGSLIGPTGQLAGASLGLMSGAISEATNLTNFLLKMYEEREVHAMIPNSANGTVGQGYTNVSIDKYGFQIEVRSITAEIAKSIDNFFDLFGYKVNTVKIPNIAGRPRWNYVKTVGVNIVGNIPADAMANIKLMYDNGLRFWKNPSEMFNYSLYNGIS